MRKTQKNDSGSYTDQSRQYTDRRDQTDLPGRNAGRSGYAGYTERGGYADTSRRTGRGSYTDTVRRADRGSYADTSRRSGRGSYTDTVRRADRGSHADTSGQSGRGSYTGAPRQAERSSYAGASGRTGRGSCTDTVRRADRGSCTENKRAGRRTAARDGSGRMGGRKNRNGKRLYICLAALLALLLICGSGIFILYRGQDDKKVQEITVSLESLASPYAVLIDADTGTVLGSKNPQQKIFPASMAKIMTVLTAIEQIRDLDQTVTMSYDYYDMLYERDASRAGFEPGEEAVIRDLLYGALLPSGAECCMQLALQAAGSESAFADLMNENALKMGLTQTQFKNCTGLHDEEQYSTVSEIATILQNALDNKTFYQVFTTKSYTVQPTQVHPEGFTFQSTMFKGLESPDVVGGEILGGKTGYTDDAGHCLASMARIDGREYILVTAGWAQDPTADQYHIRDALLAYNTLGSALSAKEQ